MTVRLDILGLGFTAVDELIYVDAFPAADGKVLVRRREWHCGGLTATALVAASRLGARCAYAGILGEDENSQLVLDQLGREGIDLTHVRRQTGARPVRSTVIVDMSRQTRALMYGYDGVVGIGADWPPEDLIRSARLLFVDHDGVEGMTRAVEVAHAAGIPAVADFERVDDPLFPKLLGLVDHLILPWSMAADVTGKEDPAAATSALWGPGRRTVVVTCGAQGSWYVTADHPREARHQPAFAVEAVDTTGCGDVFHGAYAAALIRGLATPAAVRFASATAALKATRRGGQAGIPTRAAVEAFLDANPHQQLGQ